MTSLSALLVLTAVLLLLPRPPLASWNRADPPAAPTTVRTAGVPSPHVALLVAAGLAGALVLGPAMAGPRGLVLAAAAVLVAATVIRLLLLRLRRRRAERTSRAVVEACTVLAASLRVGLVPTQALASAADGCPLLRPAHDTLLLGGDIATAWQRQADAPGAEGLRELARAWQVAARTGASLSSTLEGVATGQSADLALRSVVASELAASRATGKLMAALPLLGIGIGYLLGGDPLGWLAAGMAGWICLLLGVALACAGVLWIESLSRRAALEG